MTRTASMPSAPLDPRVLEQLRDTAIRDIPAAPGFELDTHGRGRCPVCDPSPGSKCFATNGRRYVCFRCGSKGDALELVGAVYRVGFREAATLLAELVGVDLNLPTDPAEIERARKTAAERRREGDARRLRREWSSRALRRLADELDLLRVARRCVGAKLVQGDDDAADRLAALADRETTIFSAYDRLTERDASIADVALLAWLDAEQVAA